MKTPQPPSPRARKRLIWLASLFLFYSLIGFLVVPPIIKWQMLKQLPDLTKRQVAVKQVRVNPWTLSLTLQGLALNELDGRPFASWDELYVNFQASSIVRLAWTFKEIRIVKPFAEIILLKDGTLNFADMLESLVNAAPKGGGGIPRVSIFQLTITNGFVAMEDRMRRTTFRTEYRPINLHLRDFTTRPDSDTPYSFHAESDMGRSVAWAGDLTVQPPRSSGRLEVTGVQLPRYQPYLEDFTMVVLTNGTADLHLEYRFGVETNGLDLVVSNATVRVAEAELLDPGTKETVAALRGFEAKNAGFNLRENVASLGEIRISQAFLLARVKQDGRPALLDLIAITPPSTNTVKKPGLNLPMPVVSMDSLTIENTALRFEDLSRKTPFRSDFKPIEVKVAGFSTRPNSDATYSFHVTTESAETFQGKGTFSINPIRSGGEFEAGALDLKKYLPYAEDVFRGKIIDGKAACQLAYTASYTQDFPDASVTNLSVTLKDLQVQLPENEETITHINQASVEGVSATIEHRKGRATLFHGEGGSLTLRRHKDGSINLLGLLAVSRTNAAATDLAAVPVTETAMTAATNAPPTHPALSIANWTLDVDEVRLQNYSLKIEDLLPEKPAVVAVDHLNVTVKDASTDPRRMASFSADLRVDGTGEVSAKGSLRAAPAMAELDVTMTNLGISVAQSYVEPFAALGISSGMLAANGKVRFQTNDATAPMLSYVGDARVSNFAATDLVRSNEFVRWDDVVLTGVDAALLPTRAKVGEVRVVRPKASLLIGPDRQPNLFAILRLAPETTNAPPATAALPASTNLTPALMPIEIGAVTLEKASFTYADESVQPNVTLGIEELSGSIKGLSSALNTPAEVDLSGMVDSQSAFAVHGRVNPFPQSRLVDLTITNANTQMTPLTGYMEKYGGYPLKKGRVSTVLHYRVNGTELQADNKVQVDQFTLGPRNNSPDATKLPLKLGVALLKDSEGRIEMDVPLTGRIDDPQFKLGPIILQVFMNVIVKAAASPFKLIGALAGGGGEELSFVAFAPGSTNLVDGELDKLTKLASALAKRPALDLDIEGSIDPVRDRDALAKAKLEELLKARLLRESPKGRTPEPQELLQMPTETRHRLLRDAFVAQFGTNIAEVIQTGLAKAQTTNQTASASPDEVSPVGFRWLVYRAGSLFGAGPWAKTREEKQLSKEDYQALGRATPGLMESLLIEKTEVSDEDFRRLTEARALWVHAWLLQTGGIAADRLLLANPKPVNASYSGESRVNLSLN